MSVRAAWIVASVWGAAATGCGGEVEPLDLHVRVPATDKLELLRTYPGRLQIDIGKDAVAFYRRVFAGGAGGDSYQGELVALFPDAYSPPTP